MSTIHPLGEVRLVHTAESRPADFTPPLLRLRGYNRPAITPETCRVRHCPICAWRLGGLLGTTGTETPVVRECPSDYCAGCNATRCCCPDPAHLDAQIERSYTLGHEHGAADGPEHRPTRRWPIDAGLDPTSYLEGYDEACAGVPPPVTETLWHDRLWDEVDDGLPF